MYAHRKVTENSANPAAFLVNGDIRSFRVKIRNVITIPVRVRGYERLLTDPNLKGGE